MTNGLYVSSSLDRDHLRKKAGLPEDEKESLKVLHYYLEDQLNSPNRVGFVAVSNHVLDAAKTNRCLMLLREEPDENELQSIASGILFDANFDGKYTTRQIDIDGDTSCEPAVFAESLCRSYMHMLHDVSWFELFFGLRDFIGFLKALRGQSITSGRVMEIRLESLIRT